MKRKWSLKRILIVVAIATLVAVAGLCLLLYEGTQYVPAFYEQALTAKQSPRQLAELGDDFERKALDLHNKTTRIGMWDAVFTEQQVNAWLASDLPKNHPNALPADLGDPRVKITPDEVKIACRYRGEHFDTVLSITADVYLTDKQNQLAIRIRSVRAGRIPLPLGGLMEQVRDVARRNRIPLVWSQEDDDPIALLQIPSHIDRPARRDLYVDKVQLRDGEIYLAGHTWRGDR